MTEDTKNVLYSADFAEICGFYRQFAGTLKIDEPDFEQLGRWLCARKASAISALENIHLCLFRKCRYNYNRPGQWENGLVRFGFEYEDFTDAVEVLAAGYVNLNLNARLRLLKKLQESLFDKSKILRNKIGNFPKKMHFQYVGTDSCSTKYLLDATLAEHPVILQVQNRGLKPRCHALVASSRSEVFQLRSRIISEERNLRSNKEPNQLIAFLEILAYAVFNVIRRCPRNESKIRVIGIHAIIIDFHNKSDHFVCKPITTF